MIASSPPNRCYAHLLSHHGYCDGLVTSSITAATVAFPTAGTRMPCPPNGLRLPAHRAHSRGFRLSEVLCHGVAPVLRRTRSCPSFILLYHARLPLSSADLAVADSPSFARRRTAAQRRAMRHVAPVARCRQAAEAIRRLLKGYAAHTHRQTILWFCRQAAAAIRRRPTMPAASSKSVSSTLSPPLEDGLPTRPDFESSTGHVADQALIRRMIRVHDSTQGRAPYGRSPSDRAPRPALRARATAASVRSPGTRAFHLWSA